MPQPLLLFLRYLTSMGDFRPISCCNTTYKCTSKIIVNRLKSTLPSLISPTQAAFVPGRRIGDNILLAQELLRNYHRSSGSPQCTIKIDLKKAFDSVRWDFLFDLLYQFHFPPKFIFWVKACVSTPMFSVKVNGALSSYFKGAKGFRQGDALSPLPFCDYHGFPLSSYRGQHQEAFIQISLENS